MRPQCVAHMPPKRRRRIRDLCGELVPTALDGLAEVEAGKTRVPAAFPGVGDATKDAGEVVQRAPHTNRIRRRFELARGQVVQGGKGLVEMLVDGIAHSSTPLRRLKFAGATSAFARTVSASRNSRASFPFA